MVRLSVLVCLSLALPVVRAQNYAVAKILGSVAGSSIAGTVKFEQDASAPLGDMTVTYNIENLPSNSPKLGFGFHVHQYGDTRITDKLTTMSAHFVPFQICDTPKEDDMTQEEWEEAMERARAECEKDSTHGLPPNPTRQPGDMGNIVAENSVAKGTLTIGQGKMSLVHDMRSIVGRVIVIHSKTAPHPNPNPPLNRNCNRNPKQDLGGTTPQA